MYFYRTQVWSKSTHVLNDFSLADLLESMLGRWCKYVWIYANVEVKWKLKLKLGLKLMAWLTSKGVLILLEWEGTYFPSTVPPMWGVCVCDVKDVAWFFKLLIWLKQSTPVSTVPLKMFFLSGQGLLEVAKLFCHLLEIEILK